MMHPRHAEQLAVKIELGDREIFALGYTNRKRVGWSKRLLSHASPRPVEARIVEGDGLAIRPPSSTMKHDTTINGASSNTHAKCQNEVVERSHRCSQTLHRTLSRSTPPCFGMRWHISPPSGTLYEKDWLCALLLQACITPAIKRTSQDTRRVIRHPLCAAQYGFSYVGCWTLVQQLGIVAFSFPSLSLSLSSHFIFVLAPCLMDSVLQPGISNPLHNKNACP